MKSKIHEHQKSNFIIVSKKLFLAALLVVGLATFAQDKKERPSRAEMEKMSPEQRNELHLKKMTSELDLNAKQQEQISQIISEKSTKREAMKTERKNKMLEEKKEMDEKMKKILTPEQYEKWNANKEKRRGQMKERMHDRKRD